MLVVFFKRKFEILQTNDLTLTSRLALPANLVYSLTVTRFGLMKLVTFESNLIHISN